MPTIVHLSDLHGRHERFVPQTADLLVVSGDICQTGAASEIEAALAWLSHWPAGEKVLVPGNHDYAIQIEEARFRDLCAEHGIRLLIDEFTDVAGLKVFGCPTVFDRTSWDWKPADRAFTVDESDVGRVLPVVPSDVDLLVTHAPPRGIGDQYAPGSYWEGLDAGSVGLAAFRRVLEREEAPVVHCYGHLHDAPGVRLYGRTWCSNAAGVSVKIRLEGRSVTGFEVQLP